LYTVLIPQRLKPLAAPRIKEFLASVGGGRPHL